MNVLGLRVDDLQSEARSPAKENGRAVIGLDDGWTDGAVETGLHHGLLMGAN